MKYKCPCCGFYTFDEIDMLGAEEEDAETHEVK